jgi:putative CocE/NonD family hydrolase
LTKPLTFAGPISALLYAATSAKDTDWFVRLMEVDSNGKIFDLVEGKLRARFRKSMRTPELFKEGEIYEYTLDLWQTGITIPAKHRLRVEIASASFPTFSRNLNTGGHNEKETTYVAAEQTIYHPPAAAHIPLGHRQAHGQSHSVEPRARLLSVRISPGLVRDQLVPSDNHRLCHGLPRHGPLG